MDSTALLIDRILRQQIYDEYGVVVTNIDHADIMLLLALKRMALKTKGGVYIGIKKILTYSLGSERARYVLENLPTSLRNKLLNDLKCLCEKVSGCSVYDRRKYIFYLPLSDKLIQLLIESPLNTAAKTLALMCVNFNKEW